MIVFIKILLAHLIGDFILQSNAWVKAKEEKKLKAWQLYIHALLHAAIAMMLVANADFLKYALMLGGLHLVIDAAKLLLQTDRHKQAFFFGDQLLHLISIALVYILYQGAVDFPVIELNEKTWWLILLVTLLTQPAAIGMKFLLVHWTPHTNEDNSESLQHAGKYIGILERLFVFTFVVTNNWDAVGFLIAAKSVFRFGDLTTAKDRKLTEYILIGTLISFGIAILTGIFFLTYNSK